MTETAYRPLAKVAELPVKAPEDSVRPPEPPTRPLGGPVFEQNASGCRCKVPGCSKAEKVFGGKHAISVHARRMHGLTLEGKPFTVAPRAPATTRTPIPPADDLRDVDLRGLLTGTDLALVEQTAKVLRATRDNLSGKLSEMDRLRRKAARIDRILEALGDLVPGTPT